MARPILLNKPGLNIINDPADENSGELLPRWILKISTVIIHPLAGYIMEITDIIRPMG